jgi:hypothetical protein
MSAGNVDILLKVISGFLNDHPPFLNHTDMYKSIDAIPSGGVDWEAFMVKYNGPLPDGDVPHWMTAEHEVYFCDPHSIIKEMISNTDYKDEFDYAPYREYGADNLQRFHHFMSGEWAWKQAVGQLTLKVDLC